MQTDELELVEATTIAIAPDPDVAAALRLEFIDPSGAGFVVLLDTHEAIDLVSKVMGELARLTGGGRKWRVAGLK
jgi:hypothetical protein